LSNNHLERYNHHPMKPTYGQAAPSVLSPHPRNAFGEYSFSPTQLLELSAEVEINRKS
jgi:hypothetical protein